MRAQYYGSLYGSQSPDHVNCIKQREASVVLEDITHTLVSANARKRKELSEINNSSKLEPILALVPGFMTCVCSYLVNSGVAAPPLRSRNCFNSSLNVS